MEYDLFLFHMPWDVLLIKSFEALLMIPVSINDVRRDVRPVHPQSKGAVH